MFYRNENGQLLTRATCFGLSALSSVLHYLQSPFLPRFGTSSKSALVFFMKMIPVELRRFDIFLRGTVVLYSYIKSACMVKMSMSVLYAVYSLTAWP